MQNIYKKGMIFGVFDRLHDGHIFFIKEAKTLCENLTIVLARDKNVKILKNKEPYEDENLRIQNIKNKFKDINIILGDEEKNSWQIIKDQKPDIIILGYDQKELFSTLSEKQVDFNFKIKQIEKDYMGEILHTSLLG